MIRNKVVTITCPRCGFTSREATFIVIWFFSGTGLYNCPECGAEWHESEKVLNIM